MPRVHGSVPSAGDGLCCSVVGGAICRRGCAGVHLGCGLCVAGADWVVVSHAEGARLCSLGGDGLCLSGAVWGYSLPRVHWCVPWAWIGCRWDGAGGLFAVGVCWRAPSMRVGILWGWLGGGKSCRGWTVVHLGWGMVLKKARCRGSPVGRVRPYTGSHD